MNAVQTLIRRTAAALGTIAALTVPGLATAQVVTLTGASGSSCTYTQMTVLPNGNVAVTCNTVASPGVFTLTAPTSLSTSSQSTASQVRINRAGGSAGDVTIGFSLSGTSGCTSATPTPVTFADGDLLAKSILVDTNSTPGACVVALLAPSAGTLGLPSSKTISVVDPDSPVAFAFAASSSGASVGSSVVQVVVTRTGGTNNAWTVPVTMSGSLTLGGAMITGAGSVSPSTLVLSFPANSSQAVLTFTPPPVTPGSPVLPASVQFALGTPASLTAPAGQTGTSGAGTHTLTLNGPAVGCPVPETVANSALSAYANGTTLRMPSGAIQTYALPAPTVGKSTGTWRISAGTSSYPIAPYHFEVHINKCKGLVDGSAGGSCYGKFSTKTGIYSKNWFTKTVAAPYDTAAKIQAAGYCYAPPADGPWYVNIRYTYAGCEIAGNCGWNYQWYNWAY